MAERVRPGWMVKDDWPEREMGRAVPVGHFHQRRGETYPPFRLGRHRPNCVDMCIGRSDRSGHCRLGRRVHTA